MKSIYALLACFFPFALLFIRAYGSQVAVVKMVLISMGVGDTGIFDKTLGIISPNIYYPPGEFGVTSTQAFSIQVAMPTHTLRALARTPHSGDSRI
jgi:hypothetical protein